jgi:hypothetical protein
MFPDPHRVLGDESCPVSDQLLGELYRANLRAIDQLTATMDRVGRAALAMYCYRRAHLASVGIAIAATCEEDDLGRFGGQAGELLFARSREAPQPPRPHPHFANRPKITLASGALLNMGSFEDDEVEAS